MEPEQIDRLLEELFDEDYYRAAYLAPDDPRDARLVFAEEGDRLGHRPSLRFDPAFYRERYSDARESRMPPLRHYVGKGIRNGYAPNRFRQLAQSNLIGPLLDGRLLGIAPPPGEDEESRLLRIEAAFERYLIAAAEDPLADPSPAFSVAFYRERHADTRRYADHALIHYLRHGHQERRQTSADVIATLREGGRPLDPARPGAIVCLHELSLTGAPIVGLDLIEALAATHNVMCLSRRGGALEPRVAAATVTYGVDVPNALHAEVLVGELARRAEIAFALVNSVEAWHCLPALNRLGAPILTLIHEYADYVFPQERVASTVLMSDRLLFSSRAIARTWEKVVADRHEFTFRHATIRHQSPAAIEADVADASDAVRARLGETLGVPLAGRTLVLGAAGVQMRKGTDLFVSTAMAYDRLARDGVIDDPRDAPALFLWVGGLPDRDEFGFGLWLSQQVEQAPAERLVFVPAGPWYRDLIRAADLLFLSSRRDPFPNVVIDALCAGTPVLLFEGATGCPEALDRYEVAYAEAAFGDVVDAARKIAGQIGAPPDRDALSAAARAAFAFPPYLAAVLAAVDSIRQDRAAAMRDPLFATLDLAYFRLPFAPLPLGREHDAGVLRTFWTRALHAGFDAFNPRAGLNLRNAREGRLIADDPPRTHRSIALPPPPRDAGAPPYAIHYHAHFTEGLDDLLARHPDSFAGAARILFTTDEEAKRAVLAEAAKAAGVACEILCVPNRGRNFGPLFALAERGLFGECELVLHLHAKRSARLGEERARRWRDYLHDTLLADARGIAGRFAAEPGLGGVWPENQRALGWGENRAAARALMGEGWPPPPSPRQFPSGAMFWVRRPVLERIWRDLALPLDVWPEEPIADDGTPLHALERRWPDLIERAGAEWATAFDPSLSRY